MTHARVLCLMDEGAQVGTPLIGSKGDSFLFEVDGKRVMFDTGRSGRHLAHNMSILKVKADSVDAIMISFPSLDHIGGLNTFMTNRTKPVEVYAFTSVWDCKRLMGPLVSPDNVGGVKKQDAGADWIQITEHLFLSPSVDDTGEMCAVLRTNDGPVVFCGRAASGIAPILGKVKERFGPVRGLVGGLYLKGKKQPAVNEVAATIRDIYSVREIHLNGCTGREGIQKMRVATSNDKIKDLFAGDELDYTV